MIIKLPKENGFKDAPNEAANAINDIINGYSFAKE